MSGKKYFDLYAPREQYACVMAPKEISRLIIPKKGWVKNWKALPLFVPPNKGIIADYMFSVLIGRFCSDKLKEVIESNKGEKDIIQWLPIDIFVEETEETLRYHHLHFPEPWDNLSHSHCKYLPDGNLVVPFYSYKKIKNHEIFNTSAGYEKIITILSDRMLKAIEDSGCIGLNVKPSNVIYDEKSTVLT